MPRSDEDLLIAIKGGDQQALRELFDRHARWLTLRLRRRCGDDGLVDETVVDTFERVWRKADTHRGEGDVGAWLWRIALHRLIDRRRKSVPQPLPRRSVAGIVHRTASSPVDDDVADRVALALEHTDVGTLLEQLAPELRMVLQATVLDGLTVRETADLLGIAPGTVKSRAHRARQRLREEMS